ncbi:hypothetical protein MRB53_014346 [Persea americana]|uniref:Uncharacterized protein n=1 Tax=Persea americana TaxID=3435 RepID=A0ACC2KAH4_PERAE|nr:hypothetical protein MRB53_014346 [Persea americana]
MKLDNTNFLLWKSLFRSILRSHHLEHFIDGSKPVPPWEIIIAYGKTSLNQSFSAWFKCDQTLLSWINVTLPDYVLPYIVENENARDAWESLEHRYGSLSRSHVIELKKYLRHVKKGSFPCKSIYINSSSPASPAPWISSSSTNSSPALQILRQNASSLCKASTSSKPSIFAAPVALSSLRKPYPLLGLVPGTVGEFIPNFDIQSTCGFETRSISDRCMNITTRSELKAMVPENSMVDVRHIRFTYGFENPISPSGFPPIYDVLVVFPF